MSGKILQINFKFKVSSAEYVAAVNPMAANIAEVPGLLWKVWLMNETDHEAGGIYWFNDAASLQAYLESPIVATISNRQKRPDILSAGCAMIHLQLRAATLGSVFLDHSSCAHDSSPPRKPGRTHRVVEQLAGARAAGQ